MGDNIDTTKKTETLIDASKDGPKHVVMENI
jgi:hypothetical protein